MFVTQEITNLFVLVDLHKNEPVQDETYGIVHYGTVHPN